MSTRVRKHTALRVHDGYCRIYTTLLAGEERSLAVGAVVEERAGTVAGGSAELVEVEARTRVAVVEPDRRLTGDNLGDALSERSDGGWCSVSLHRIGGPSEAIPGHVPVREQFGVTGVITVSAGRAGSAARGRPRTAASADDPPATAAFVPHDDAGGRPVVPRRVGNRIRLRGKIARVSLALDGVNGYEAHALEDRRGGVRRTERAERRVGRRRGRSGALAVPPTTRPCPRNGGSRSQS